MRRPTLGVVWGCLAFATTAGAQTIAPVAAAPPAVHAPRPHEGVTSEVVVTASRSDLLGKATTASQGSITQEEVKLRPAYRVGELLESVPGLVVTSHSGEGKANQFLARGFNLDHGTDIANFIDDMPINRPSNTHGEGYSDLNFIIPEVLDGLDYTKGPYDPSIGDFGDIASVHVKLADMLPAQLTLSGDTFAGYGVFVGGSRDLGPNDHLLAAAEFNKVDGPFDPPTNFRKDAAILRYSHGSTIDGYDVTAMYYHGVGLFNTDQPARAVHEGLIGRYGTLDPSDLTRNERYSLSGHYATQGDAWALKTSAYYVHSRQTLFNDFTHFLEDPVNGDQEQQDETRDLFGGQAAVTYRARIAGLQSDTTFGVQGRYDDVYIDRRHTLQRHVLSYCKLLQADGAVDTYSVGRTDCTVDQVHEYDAGPYVENATRFTPWLRTDVGVREEFFGADDHNLLPGRPFSQTPFTQNVTLFQPKGSLTVGPVFKTEFYVSAGRGFHSNDIRSVSGTVLLEGIPGIAGVTPLVTKVDGEEIGLRSDIVPRTHIQFAAFNVRVQSEEVYDQDQGEDVPGPPSKRDGVEVSAQYRPYLFLELNADLSFSHARYDTPFLAAFGDTGSFIPLAPNFVGSFGAIVDNLGPFYGGLQVRILGSYPLVSDNSQRDAGYSETNVNVGYKIARNLKAQVQVFNLFDVRANAAAFYYATIIPGDDGVPISDHQNHALEPISARFSVTATF